MEIEKLKQLKREIEQKRNNDSKVYEDAELYKHYSVFSNLIDNMIELKEV